MGMCLNIILLCTHLFIYMPKVHPLDGVWRKFFLNADMENKQVQGWPVKHKLMSVSSVRLFSSRPKGRRVLYEKKGEVIEMLGAHQETEQAWGLSWRSSWRALCPWVAGRGGGVAPGREGPEQGKVCGKRLLSPSSSSGSPGPSWQKLGWCHQAKRGFIIGYSGVCGKAWNSNGLSNMVFIATCFFSIKKLTHFLDPPSSECSMLLCLLCCFRCHRSTWVSWCYSCHLSSP